MNFKNNDEIELYFEKNTLCSLTVDKVTAYEFKHEDGALKVTWILKDSHVDNDLLRPDFLSIIPIEHNEDIFRGGLKSLTNCCSMGGKEWCVKNGCMVAPCGKICG